MYFNLKRANEYMDRFEVDVLIASTPENVTYLSDTVSWAPKVYAYSVDMFVIYFRDPNIKTSLIVPSQEMTYVSGSGTWVEDIYTYGGKSALIQTNEISSLLFNRNSITPLGIWIAPPTVPDACNSSC